MSFQESETELSPPRRVLLAAEALSSAIVARWRVVVLTFILISAIWLAFQVFVIAREAYLYLRDNVPKLSDLQFQATTSPRVWSVSPGVSSVPITNCWRDRSLAVGDCFDGGGAHSESPSALPHVPASTGPRIPGHRRIHP
jgi:hypothetical protein